MDIGEADAFSERLKRELQALEAANVHAIMENETLIHQVVLFFFYLFISCLQTFVNYFLTDGLIYLYYVVIQFAISTGTAWA